MQQEHEELSENWLLVSDFPSVLTSLACYLELNILPIPKSLCFFFSQVSTPLPPTNPLNQRRNYGAGSSGVCIQF